jgi:hypothetical protein
LVDDDLARVAPHRRDRDLTFLRDAHGSRSGLPSAPPGAIANEW